MEKILSDIWNELPELPHTRKYFDEKMGLRVYEVCNRKFHETVKVNNVLKMLKIVEAVYGNRSRKAKETNFYDFKAISHAFRAGYQTKEILEHGTITFPLKQAKFIVQVKTGQLDYESVVAPALNFLVDDIEVLSAMSKLPEKIDQEYLDNLLFELLEKELHD